MMKNWIQLSPLGYYYHPFGKQYLSKESLNSCIKNTRSWFFLLGLKKIPIYIGHPDDPYFQQFPEHMNNIIYGYVQDFCMRENGLWIQVAWKEIGEELIENGKYLYLSPRWEMEASGECFLPKKLLSVGLTNTPNLPVEPIIKQKAFRDYLLPSKQGRAEKMAILGFVQKVYQRMQTTGESYPEAWNAILKKTNV